jgi:hypothetical protein
MPHCRSPLYFILTLIIWMFILNPIKNYYTLLETSKPIVAPSSQMAESPSNYTLKPTTLTNRLLLQTSVTVLVALIDGFLINTSSSTFLSVSSSTPSHLIKTTNLPLYRWKWAPAFFNRLLKSNTLV